MGVGSIANTGLKAAMTNMEVISNNIANANTVGFKKSWVNFSDISVNSISDTRQIGFGVKTESLSQDFSLGRIELTDRGLDLSLSNDGFFVQKNSSGQTSYTRAGRLDLDKNNYFTSAGGRLQGYPAVNGNIMTSGALTDLRLSETPLPANPTTKATLGLNLDASATVPTLPFNNSDATTYNYRSDTTVYDSLGKSYAMSVYYIKAADNTWTTQIDMDNQSIGSGSIEFQSNGTLSTTTGMDALSWTPNSGATSPQTLAINYASTTQYAGDYKTTVSDQDGYMAGIPTGYHIDDDGKVNMYYSNGQTQMQGQIAVARFQAPQGLSKAENMSWLATTDSGDPLLDPSGSLGAINSGTIELSNVDLTEELVKLMGAQHDFQANAQVAQTYNQILQTIENI